MLKLVHRVVHKRLPMSCMCMNKVGKCTEPFWGCAQRVVRKTVGTASLHMPNSFCARGRTTVLGYVELKFPSSITLLGYAVSLLIEVCKDKIQS